MSTTFWQWYTVLDKRDPGRSSDSHFHDGEENFLCAHSTLPSPPHPSSPHSLSRGDDPGKKKHGEKDIVSRLEDSRDFNYDVTGSSPRFPRSGTNDDDEEGEGEGEELDCDLAIKQSPRLGEVIGIRIFRLPGSFGWILIKTTFSATDGGGAGRGRCTSAEEDRDA